MTQKDSEDAPANAAAEEAGRGGSSPEVPEVAPEAPAKGDGSASDGPQETPEPAASVSEVVPPESIEPAIEPVAPRRLPLEQRLWAYDQEHAPSIALDRGQPPSEPEPVEPLAEVSAVDADPAPAEPIAEATALAPTEVTDSSPPEPQQPSYDEQSAPRVELTDATAPSLPEAIDAVLPSQPADDDRRDLPPEPSSVEPEIADEQPSLHAENDVAGITQLGWGTPPPVNEAPAWVWRDVVPDIFPAQTPETPPVEVIETPPAPAEAAVPQAEVLAEPLPEPESEPETPQEAPMPADTDVEPHRPSEIPKVASAAVSAAAASAALNLRVPEPEPERREPVFERQSAVSPASWQQTRPSEWRRDDEAAQTADADEGKWDRAKSLARTGLRYAGYGIAGYFALVFVLILLYRFVNPPASALMLVQGATGTDVNQEWVPLDEISPALVRAVIVSEDWSFCEHYGIDLKAIEQAIEKSGDGIPRGASTISMQTTKNLFLWNAKSYIRKAVEVPLTLMIETIWPKRRILEIYLNVAEWGPGIFGAEAAAQYHFNKPAARLGEREAAQLAASLPNPIIREAGDPGPRTARKATVIQSRMRNAGDAAQCVLGRR